VPLLTKNPNPFCLFQAAVYQWSTETQGIIFSSISYGIILTLIPSGYLAGIFGAKQILGAGLLISSLLTLFTPLAADFGVILVIVIRTVQGMAQVSRYYSQTESGTDSRHLQNNKGLNHFHCREWPGLVSSQFGQSGLRHLNGASSPALRVQVRTCKCVSGWCFALFFCDAGDFNIQEKNRARCDNCLTKEKHTSVM
jgi:hypothetical protein